MTERDLMFAVMALIIGTTLVVTIWRLYRNRGRKDD